MALSPLADRLRPKKFDEVTGQSHLFSKNGILTRVCSDRAISIEELDNELSKLDRPIFLCGDGYDITLKGFKNTVCQYVPERLRLQSAYSVCACALEKYNNGEILTDAELVPIYLRPSQAERERLERIEAQKNQ